MKFTKGPWKVLINGDQSEAICSSNGKTTIAITRPLLNDPDGAQRIANAKIIGQAPTMLKAIIKTEDWLVKNIGFLNPETRKIIVRLTRIIHDVKATNKFSETPTNSQR
jgi:hypothetical protein